MLLYSDNAYTLRTLRTHRSHTMFLMNVWIEQFNDRKSKVVRGAVHTYFRYKTVYIPPEI